MGSRHYLYDGNPGWERRVNEQWAREQVAEDEHIELDSKGGTMNKYSVEFSDRKKRFYVAAIDPRDAVAIAAGKRLYSACPSSRDVNRDNVLVSWVYQCNMRDGPKIRGSTPCRQVRAYINIA